MNTFRNKWFVVIISLFFCSFCYSQSVRAESTSETDSNRIVAKVKLIATDDHRGRPDTLINIEITAFFLVVESYVGVRQGEILSVKMPSDMLEYTIGANSSRFYAREEERDRLTREVEVIQRIQSEMSRINPETPQLSKVLENLETSTIKTLESSLELANSTMTAQLYQSHQLSFYDDKSAIQMGAQYIARFHRSNYPDGILRISPLKDYNLLSEENYLQEIEEKKQFKKRYPNIGSIN